MAEKKFRMSGERLAIFGLLIALAFTLAGFSIASAVVNNTDGTTNACYKKARGQLRVAVTPCTSKETGLTLNRPVPMFAHVAHDGALIAGNHVVSITHVGTGAYLIKFDRNISACATTATADTFTAVVDATPTVSPTAPQVAEVEAEDNAATTDEDTAFSIIVAC